MRSQKQTNKSPRPFKSGNSARSWGNQKDGFIPGQKPTPKLKKKEALVPPSPEPPPDQENSGEIAAS